MTLEVIGAGLVSPAGLSSTEHVFFLRAGVTLPARSPFLTAEDRRVPVAYCPWIGARASVAERLERMAEAALAEADPPRPGADPIALLLCVPPPRPGLTDADTSALGDRIARRLGARAVTRFQGEAGAFAALGRARSLLSGGAAGAVVLVAADSLVSPEALADRLARPPSPYAEAPLDPGEGSAALVLVPPARGRAAGRTPLGTIDAAATAPGAATDDDDEIVDGAAMTAALRALPRGAPARAVFGQARVDGLRAREWEIAVARSAERLHPEHEVYCLEESTGALGAAAGAMHLAYGLAVLRHAATREPTARDAPFYAWAISRDGTRGIAAARVPP